MKILGTDEFRARVAALWQNLRLLAGVLGLVRFQLIMLAIGLLLVLMVAQARDLLIAYGLQFESQPGWWAAWLLITAFGCALVLWYSARVMFRFRFVRSEQRFATEPRVAPSDQSVFPWLKHHLPRWLGAAVYLILLLGIALLWDPVTFTPWQLVLALIGSLALFVAFVNLRRRLFRLPRYASERTHNNLTGFTDLPSSTRHWFWFLLASNVLVMLMATRAPHAMAAIIGPGAVLLLGASLAVVVGSVLVYWSNWFRFPVVIVTLLLIAASSYVNDNHNVRLCADMRSTDEPDVCATQAVQRPTAVEALDQWVAARRADGPVLPIVLVASEGGGMRAAYWTAAVLGALEDDTTDSHPFHRYVFGISGVSGGSLGSAVFAALIRDGKGGSFLARGERVLESDFLGPTLVTLMFPDLLQRFIPYPLFDDRGMTLERTFERRWLDVTGSNTFAQPFAALWDRPASDVPLLLFNSTVVETGERLIYSPLRIDRDARATVLDALDGRAALGDSLPLSTAVHNSARFPILSPAGRFRRGDLPPGDEREHWARLVDGGYFENSGSLTANELLQLILDQRPALAQKYGVQLEPLVIQITNSEAGTVNDCDPRAQTPVTRTLTEVCFRQRWLGESLSPLYGLLNVRTAHTRLAMDQLRDAAPVGRYLHFALRNNGVVHPLGWMLARPSRVDIRCQVLDYDQDGCADVGPSAHTVRAERAAVVSFLNSIFEP
ncbi:MAG: hypothetical protein AB8G17_09565 [Gammaproteobacteria bacterium]